MIRKFILIVMCLNFCLASAVNFSGQNIFSLIASKTQNKKLQDNTKKNPDDKPLKIKKRHHPRGWKCQQDSGNVVLKTTFDKSAVVTDVEIITSSGCESFDNFAIMAAKKTKFEPEVKDGEPVTVKKRLQYSFKRY